MLKKKFLNPLNNTYVLDLKNQLLHEFLKNGLLFGGWGLLKTTFIWPRIEVILTGHKEKYFYCFESIFWCFHLNRVKNSTCQIHDFEDAGMMPKTSGAQNYVQIHNRLFNSGTMN